PEQQIHQLTLGQDVQITSDAVPGLIFHGHIQSIDSRINPDTRNVQVRAEVPNPDRKALPGMFANVSVLVGGVRDMITLPRTAITFSLYGDSVFVVKPADQTPNAPLVVDRRFVRTGEVRDESVSILEGVVPGEKVVSTGQLKLRAGAHVVIVPDGNL